MGDVSWVLVIVVVMGIVLLGLGYGFTRRGSGIAEHPLGGRRREEGSGQAPGAGSESTSLPDRGPTDG